MARTRGRVEVHGRTLVSGSMLGMAYDQDGWRNDAHTWAIAHNTANAIDDMGYDGDKAIGHALVEFVAAMREISNGTDNYLDHALEAMWKFMSDIERKKDE